MAMGGDKNNPNVIEVIDIACDECPVSGYNVTSACRDVWHIAVKMCAEGELSHLTSIKRLISISQNV